MSADGAVHEWARQVEETADRLAREAVQQLQTNQPRALQPLGRGTLPAGLFDPSLPNHPLPSQPPARAREAAKLAAVIAASPAPRPPTVPSESASLLSAVDAILAEAEAVLKRERHADDTEEKEGRQAESLQRRTERQAAITQARTHRSHRSSQPAPQLRQPAILATQAVTALHSTSALGVSHARLPVSLATQSSHSTEVLRMKKAIELRTEQRRRERDEALKADMLDRQRRDIIARYEEADGKRREEEERKEQEEDRLGTQQQQRQEKAQQEHTQRERAAAAAREREAEQESKRQQLKQELDDKKRQAAEAIRHQRLLAKQQQQQQLVAQYTQTLQRRTDKRLLQRMWQQWLAALVDARQVKHSKAVCMWRYNSTVRTFRQWRSALRQAKEDRRRIEDDSLRRRKEDRRVQAAAHWKLRSTQRSAAPHISKHRPMFIIHRWLTIAAAVTLCPQPVRCMALVPTSEESVLHNTLLSSSYTRCVTIAHRLVDTCRCGVLSLS